SRDLPGVRPPGTVHAAPRGDGAAALLSRRRAALFAGPHSHVDASRFARLVRRGVLRAKGRFRHEALTLLDAARLTHPGDPDGARSGAGRLAGGSRGWALVGR